MAKTKRRKQNRSPKVGKVAVVEQGFRVQIAGHRSPTDDGPGKIVPAKDAKPVFIGRVYTGLARGKVYPYAGKKRGGGKVPTIGEPGYHGVAAPTKP